MRARGARRQRIRAASKLEADWGGDSAKQMYRVCLVTASAKLPLTAGYSGNLHRHMAMRDAILEALTTPAARA